jgi:hypothetical protein
MFRDEQDNESFTSDGLEKPMRKQMTNKLLMVIAAAVIGLGGLAATSADAAIVVDFGNDPAATQLTQVNPAAAINVADVQESSSFTSGTFTTTGAGPVTFDLDITATANIQGQNFGFGVNGGTAGLGVDNNNTAGPLETMTFAISDFTGLGVGESLVITHVTLLFGTTSETYTINGGSDIFFTTAQEMPDVVDVPDATTVTIGAGTQGDTRFAIDSITVAVETTAIPEPASLAMGLMGLTLIGMRRRFARA